MHPPMPPPPPPPRRVAEPWRPSRVSFERKLEDCTLTAAAAPVRLPLLRQERRSGRRRVDPRVPDDAFDDAEADPSEQSTGNAFFDRTDQDEKTPALDDDAEAGPWVLGRSGLLLVDDKKRIGEDAKAELRLEWRTENRRFFDRTGSDEETRSGDAEAGPSVLGRSGLHLFADSYGKKTTGVFDDSGVHGLERCSFSDGRRRTARDDGEILDEA